MCIRGKEDREGRRGKVSKEVWKSPGTSLYTYQYLCQEAHNLPTPHPGDLTLALASIDISGTNPHSDTCAYTHFKFKKNKTS